MTGEKRGEKSDTENEPPEKCVLFIWTLTYCFKSVHYLKKMKLDVDIKKKTFKRCLFFFRFQIFPFITFQSPEG